MIPLCIGSPLGLCVFSPIQLYVFSPTLLCIWIPIGLFFPRNGLITNVPFLNFFQLSSLPKYHVGNHMQVHPQQIAWGTGWGATHPPVFYGHHAPFIYFCCWFVSIIFSSFFVYFTFFLSMENEGLTEGARPRAEMHPPKVGDRKWQEHIAGKKIGSKYVGNLDVAENGCTAISNSAIDFALQLSMCGKSWLKVKVDQSVGLKAPTTHWRNLIYRNRNWNSEDFS